jgi:hypothetical protein
MGEISMSNVISEKTRYCFMLNGKYVTLSKTGEVLNYYEELPDNVGFTSFLKVEELLKKSNLEDIKIIQINETTYKL